MGGKKWRRLISTPVLSLCSLDSAGLTCDYCPLTFLVSGVQPENESSQKYSGVWHQRITWSLWILSVQRHTNDLFLWVLLKRINGHMGYDRKQKLRFSCVPLSVCSKSLHTCILPPHLPSLLLMIADLFKTLLKNGGRKSCTPSQEQDGTWRLKSSNST